MQINLERRQEEIKQELNTLKEDIEIIQNQLRDQVKRKRKVEVKVKNTTEHFKLEAIDLLGELQRVRSKLLEVSTHKDKVEDQATYMLEDRGKTGSLKKYEKSINEFLDLAKSLRLNYDKLQDNILTLDSHFKIDSFYTDKKGRVKAPQQFYRSGRFGEKEKTDTMIKDI